MLSIGRCISYWAERKGGEVAILDDAGSLSWRDLDARTNRLARAFAEMGVGVDDIVVITLPNSVEFYEMVVATWKLGATPLPLSARMPAIERDPILALVNPRLVVGSGASDQALPTIASDFSSSPALSDGPLPDIVPENWKAIASGGSTGTPKIIVTTLPGSFDPQAPDFTMETEGVHLVAGPLYHNAPFIFSSRALCNGNRLVVMPKFDAEGVLERIEKERVTYTVMVPTMMQRIWKLPDETKAQYDISSLGHILHTGAACPPWLKQAWIDWIGPEAVLEVYGGTEACGACWITGTEWLQKQGSVGRPLDGFQFRILDADGQPCAPHEIGDIHMMPTAGPGTSYRYIGGTSHRTDDGWEWIGDIGHADEDGYIYLSDRRSDLIISGGANIYPAEVEAAIDSFPGVSSNAVIGLPDDDLGARVHAVIYASDPVDQAALLAHLGDRLVRYKIPRTFEFVDAPVRDEAGKVRRSALRDERMSIS